MITPPGHVYLPTSKSYLYPIFFSPNQILQAKNGAWGIKDTHTTAPQGRAYAVWFFVLSGKIAHVLNIEPTTFYTITQILGMIAVYAAAYFLATVLLPKKYQALALLFAFFIELGPDVTSLVQYPVTKTFSPANSAFILLFRFFGLPHHAWGDALALLSFAFLIRTYQKRSLPNALALFITTITSAFFLPPVVITLGLSVYPMLILLSFLTRTFNKLLLPLVIATIAVAIAGIQTKIAFANAGFPWSAWTTIEKSWWTNTDAFHQYASSLIPYIPFGILLGIAILFRWKLWTAQLRQTMFLLAVWVAMPLIYIPISDKSFFPVANMRLLDGNLYVAAGFLSAISLIESASLIKHAAIRRMTLVLFTAITLGTSVLVSSMYTIPFLAYQANMDPHAYPFITTWEGVKFLKTVPKGSGILVREPFGEILPGFADIRVYIGGQHGFPDWLDRQAKAVTFFSGTMQEDQALQFLKTHDIQYVFYGPDEQAVTAQKPLYPNILKPVFQNATVTIFKVQ